MSISDLIIVMQAGTLKQVGKPQEVYDDPNCLFVAKFLGTPAINVFDGSVRSGKLYLGDAAVLDVPGAPDGNVTVGIRPEGFLVLEDGAFECGLSAVEVMGRDMSVIATHPSFQGTVIRAIIPSEYKPDTSRATVRFGLKPNKVFLFDPESGERIGF